MVIRPAIWLAGGAYEALRKRMVIVCHFVHTTNCRLAAFGLTGGTHGALGENAWRSPITPPTR